MTIEEFYINYLNEKLTPPVSGDVPTPMPAKFVTVEQTGSSEANKIRTATLAVQSWAETRAEAGKLCEEVIGYMEASVSEISISRCALQTSYNYTDVATKKPRYQAVFEVVFYL